MPPAEIKDNRLAAGRNKVPDYAVGFRAPFRKIAASYSLFSANRSQLFKSGHSGRAISCSVDGVTFVPSWNDLQNLQGGAGTSFPMGVAPPALLATRDLIGDGRPASNPSSR